MTVPARGAAVSKRQGRSMDVELSQARLPPLLVSPPMRVEERLAVGVVRPSQVTKVTLT
jgi:hypothetical protein